MQWNTPATDDQIQETIASLGAHGMEAVVVQTGAQAKELVKKMIPEKAEVMTMTSVTLDTTGIETDINTSGTYDAVKPKLYAMDRNTQGKEMQKLGAAPDWVIGSVHAITQDGKVVIASNTGSQLPAYIYAANHVIWIVGAQKITKNLSDALKRIEEYVLPLESERAKKAYGVPGSFISKLAIIHREVSVGRITIIIVKESLGF